VLEIKPSGEAFGAIAITKEVNLHYGKRLRRPVTTKLVSIVLRRLHHEGQLRQIRPGRPHHEALYARA
jgi:hypothetical protein